MTRKKWRALSPAQHGRIHDHCKQLAAFTVPRMIEVAVYANEVTFFVTAKTLLYETPRVYQELGSEAEAMAFYEKTIARIAST
jgi:hypothetical protein